MSLSWWNVGNNHCKLRTRNEDACTVADVTREARVHERRQKVTHKTNQEEPALKIVRIETTRYACSY